MKNSRADKKIDARAENEIGRGSLGEVLFESVVRNVVVTKSSSADKELTSAQKMRLEEYL